jgi:hypothetical protein
MIFNSPPSLNKKSSNRLKIFISGSGSEFNQVFISKKDDNKWIKNKETLSQNYSVVQISLWNQFCIDYLNGDGYWDVSDVSAFTAINRDHAFIEIYVNDKLFFSGNIDALMNEYFDGDEIENSKNVSNDYGKSYLPDDGEILLKD